MFGDTVYRFEAGDDGASILTKVTHVSLDDVRLSQGDDGEIKITEKLKPPVQALKYQLESDESGLYRLVLLRDLPGYSAGQHGGLVENSRVLSHEGDCWIDARSRVTSHQARVWGDAQVLNSSLHGDISLHNGAVVSHTTIRTEGHVLLGGAAELVRVTIHGDGGGMLDVRGNSKIADSTLFLERNRHHLIDGCCVADADIAGENELLSYMTRWGWMSAHRDKEGGLAVRVGCQHVGNFDGLRSLARQVGLPQVQQDMLEGFIQMVTVAQTSWRPGPAPVQPDPAPSDTFRDMAQRAREVSQLPRLRSATSQDAETSF